jgi:hypothetical protein
MRRSISVAIAGVLAMGYAAPARAHDPDLEAKVRLEAKLREPWVKAAGFTADFDRAMETAVKSGKPIFGYFTLSYTEVPPCEVVEKGVLMSAEFRKFSEGVVLFTHVTSGLPGKYADLLREKGGSSVPCFMVLDGTGLVLAKVAGAHDVASFEKAVRSGAEFAALRKKPDKTPDEQVQVLTQDMDLGNLKLPVARERLAKLGALDEGQKRKVADAMLRLEIWSAASGAGDSLDRTLAAGKLFAGMWAEGREPTTEDHVWPFFSLILDHAESVNDPKLFKKALDRLRERFKEKPDWKIFDDWQTERLKRIESVGVEAGGSRGDDGAK